MIESHCDYHHSAMYVCVCVGGGGGGGGGGGKTMDMNRHTLPLGKMYTMVCEWGGGRDILPLL